MVKKSEGAVISKRERFIAKTAAVLMTILSIIAIAPFFHVASKAVSHGFNVTSGQVYFWPKGFQLETMYYVLKETKFLNAFKNSMIITVTGTAVSLFATITTAYPLSKRDLAGRKIISLIYVVSMIFFGGMIPAYMVIRTLGIYNTYAACILPFAIVQFNMFIMKNYFEGLPESIEESARIDGAGDVRVLLSIVLPTSTPVIATVGLLYAVTYWNNYFHAMMYTKSADMQTLQVYLYNMINNSDAISENILSGMSTTNITADGMVAAAVTLSILPMMAAYPFVSRYLISGITIGSVKG